MGIDISALFGQAKQAAEQGMNDFLKQGGNAALGYLEQQAINTIQADKMQHEQAYARATQDMLSRPSQPNSFGNYLSGITQSPVLKQYGPYLLGAVGIIVVATLMMRGK